MEFPRKENIVLEGHDTPLQFQITDFFVPEADKSKRILSRDPNKREEIDYKKDPEEYKVILYGCTQDGNSVCAEVTNYCPYFYVRIPARFSNRTEKEIKTWISEFKMYLLEGTYHDPIYFKKYQKDVSIITNWYKKHLVSVKLEYKKEFMGFTNGQLFPFMKITVKSLALFNRLKYFFQSPPQDFLTKYKEPFKLYESNIDPMLRCIHDLGILPCGWVELPAKCYSVLANGCEDDSYCRTNFTVEVHYKYVKPLDNNGTAPLTIASFDIECTSSHGDFPVAIKDYQKLAKDLISVAQCIRYTKDDLIQWITRAYKEDVILNDMCKIHRLYPIEKVSELNLHNALHEVLGRVMDLMQEVKNDAEGEDGSDDEEDVGEKKKLIYYETAIKNILTWKNREKKIPQLPKLQGDAIIQIGTTVHRYGSDEIIYRNIITLKSCDPIEGVDVQAYQTEAEVLYAWKELIRRLDPDILMGYNIFGFDMPYIWDRATELLGTNNNYGVGWGRRSERECVMIEQRLSSAALGDNVLKYFDMDGVVLVDLYKVMQRTPLESYKLDFVANLYLGDQKNDLKPYEIFEKFKGSSYDRKVIAEYCVQDCALVNRLFHKLKVLENNNAMGNVCLVPLSYLFMRGQGVKIFSLVAQFCKNENFAIPVLRGFRDDVEEEDAGYEGAIVLNPKEGMYLDNAITVLDYSSLYPSSMIERNLSHDCYVNDPAYDNLPGVNYLTVTYDIYEGVGDKKKKVDEKSCKFVQLPNKEKGVIPRILMKLLTQRKNTRKKMEYETVTCKDGSSFSGLVKETETELVIMDIEKKSQWTVSKNLVVSREDTYNNFEKLVFDALQLAYKVTANSLYGQIGSRVSPIYLKDIAACTTATGRERIMMAKDFVEKNYDAKVIYGDTDSIFIKFSFYDKDGKPITGRETLPLGIAAGQKASQEIKSILPEPQSLEYEKTMFPFIIFSKKRYVGLLYEDDANKKPKLKSMGIVLKRRDNAPIVKKIYGGIIDILLYKYDLEASVQFLKQELQKLVDGKYPLEDLIITKTLKGSYKDRSKIAHCVLADRMAERDPGNKPQVNDRLPYVYIQTGGDVKLQGDRIEHPEYIREKHLTPDYQFYISNQLLKPICQIYALCVERLPGYSYSPSYWEQWNEELKNNKIYCDSELKRKNRIDALREQEAEALLFSSFMDKKRKVRSLASELPNTVTKPKKKVEIQKHVLPLDAPKLTLVVTEQKEPKQFKGKMEFFVQHNRMIEKEVFLPKKGCLSKTQATNHILIGLLKSLVLEHGSLLESHGLLLQLDKYYTRVLKNTLEEHETLMDKLALAEKECDMEMYEKYTEMLQSFQVAQLIYKYKHMFL